MKQNPFSLYDFLGYLIPGSTLIFLILIIEKLSNRVTDFNLNDVFSLASEYRLEEAFFFIIISYTLGHLISFISSITIEKYGNWKYGYPSKIVLGYIKKSFWVMEFEPKEVNDYLNIYDITYNRCDRRRKNIGRFILILCIFPIQIMDAIFGQWLQFKNFYSKGLDEYLSTEIKIKVINLLNFLSTSKDNEVSEKDLKNIDFNRIVHHYVFENSKEHQFRLVNYVALYGFLRNLVLTFVLSFWYYFATSISTLSFVSKVDWIIVLINILLMVFSYIAFMAYMKFYRRYTLEGLMLLVVNKNVSD